MGRRKRKLNAMELSMEETARKIAAMRSATKEHIRQVNAAREAASEASSKARREVVDVVLNAYSKVGKDAYGNPAVSPPLRKDPPIMRQSPPLKKASPLHRHETPPLLVLLLFVGLMICVSMIIVLLLRLARGY